MSVNETLQDGFERLPPRPLSRFVTALCTVLIVVWVLWVFMATSSRTEHLEYPELSLERIVTRGLDVREALRLVPRWERAVYLFPLKNDDPLDEALTWYQRLGRDIQSPTLRLHRLILLAEAEIREHPDTRRVFGNLLARAESEGELGPRPAAWLRGAYVDPPPAPQAAGLIAEIREVLPPEWFSDTLVARVAAHVGDTATREAAEADILARGKRLVQRLRILTLGLFGLVAAGTVALVYLIRRPRDLVLSDAMLPPIWSLLDGYGLFVRGVFWYLAISAVGTYLLPSTTPHFGLTTAVATLPLLAVIKGYAAVRGHSFRHVFGLSLPGGRRRLALVTLSLLALSLVGGTVIEVIGALLGVREQWEDFVQEDLLWGSRFLALSDAVDSSTWVPFVEELTFRGLLYSSLRARLGVPIAVGISAGLFAGGHGYGLLGLLSVFWSGTLWAVAYERTRSLLPCFVAHGIENLVATVSFAAMYRF